MAEAVENTVPEKADKRKPTSPQASTPVNSEDVKRIHGKRELREITVETFSRMEDDKPISESKCQNKGKSKRHKDSRKTSSRSSSESDVTSPIPVSGNSSISVTFGDFEPSENISRPLSKTESDGQEEGDGEAQSDESKSKPPVDDDAVDDPKGLKEEIGRPLSSRELPFFSGNPSVEVTKGILHLFKENHTTPLDDEGSRSEMLCMLAVPASMTCHSLLQFLAPCGEGLLDLHDIESIIANILEKRAADEVYKEFNNQPFNSFEDSCCHLVFISRVECMKSSEGAFLPMPYHTELPTCHICLERMDESVDGILTILCNHTFHGSCLTKWGDTSCPICRHSQTPEQVEDNFCFECRSQENLWICLVCGHIGCGRYVETHAFRHFEETQHTYAMQLGNHRVWDYAGDNYVHRLVQNKADGKPVEMNNGSTVAQDEKMDSITLEFNYLLSSQLDSQRKYFEQKIARVEEDALVRVSEEGKRSKKTLEERDRVEQQLQDLTKDKISLEKKLSQINVKLKKVSAELKEERETQDPDRTKFNNAFWFEYQQINGCLRENQKPWKEKVVNLERSLQELKQSKEKEIQDLREQLRDVMFFLEAQNTISQSPEDTRQEIQEGQIVMGATGSTPTGRSSNRRGRKKDK
ncbi:putative BRCA1-associated protein-like [Apostichopus japonicus]|uniref:Putative BRCA1-associated protein-like n=1 Tax=Stichopus japonicus TaxID=307972 RepID=A0A2G8JIS8_STIJA|nr:putative BRCA1-associated protein-like [Apostichopus japonicus]